MKDQVTELINDMLKRFNTMLSTFECCSHQVKYKLFNLSLIVCHCMVLFCVICHQNKFSICKPLGVSV